MKNKVRFSGLGLAGLIFLLVAVCSIYIAVTQKNWAAGLLAAVLAYFGSDAMFFEFGYIWTNGGLKDRYDAWKRKRRWSDKDQLEHLRKLIDGDNRWLSHIGLANEITDRYLRALDPDWYTQVHEDSSTFRHRLHLDPHYNGTRKFLVVSKYEEGITLPIVVAVKLIPPKLEKEQVRMFIIREVDNIKLQFIEKDRNNLFASWSHTVVVQDVADIDPTLIVRK